MTKIVLRFMAQRAFVGYWFKIARHELKPHG
jgi:hypothetical protein